MVSLTCIMFENKISLVCMFIITLFVGRKMETVFYFLQVQCQGQASELLLTCVWNQIKVIFCQNIKTIQNYKNWYKIWFVYFMHNTKQVEQLLATFLERREGCWRECRRQKNTVSAGWFVNDGFVISGFCVDAKGGGGFIWINFQVKTHHLTSLIFEEIVEMKGVVEKF